MSELIDRQALLDECLNHYEVGNIEQNCTMDWICKTVRNFPAASPWHRVEDELPEIGKAVVVSIYGDMWVATRLDDKRFNGRMYLELSDGSWERVENDMYWMPIEPPKEES